MRKAAGYLRTPRVTRWQVATALVVATLAFLFVMILMA